MTLYCGTPTKLRVTTSKGNVQLRGEEDSTRVQDILTSPTRNKIKLYYCDNEWETLQERYGLEISTERKDDEDFDFTSGRSFRERIRVKNTDWTLVGGEWGDQFRMGFVNGVTPVLIQLKCKEEEEFDRNNNNNNDDNNNDNERNSNGIHNKDIYYLYYIEPGTGNDVDKV